MSRTAEIRYLPDLAAKVHAADRAADRVWLERAVRTLAICPVCKRDSLHVGPRGKYCEQGDCEWEQNPERKPPNPPLSPCFMCGETSFVINWHDGYDRVASCLKHA